jgi:AcrR family transcriptional regulator
VQATIDAISEVGYARCSLGEICRRSGVSRGGLFRHFDSRLDLVVAAAREVTRRLLDRVADLPPAARAEPARMLPFMRAQVRDPINAVWFELLVAARTDADLRERLHPVVDGLMTATDDLARPLADSLGLTREQLHLVLTTLMHVFDGEAILHATYARPDLEQQRLDLLARLLTPVPRPDGEEPR